MRIFTEREEEWLILIHASDSTNLLNLIKSLLTKSNASIEIDTKQNKTTLIFAQQEDDNRAILDQKRDQIESNIIQAINLIKLFEDKGYIYTCYTTVAIKLSNEPVRFGLENYSIEKSNFETFELHKETSHLVEKYVVRSICPNPELKKFISDGFITREENRFNKQYGKTLIALSVAIFAFLANVGFNIYNTTNAPTYMKLESHQFDSLIKMQWRQSISNTRSDLNDSITR